MNVLYHIRQFEFGCINMEIREYNLFFLCVLIPTIYFGKITGYLLYNYNLDYFLTNTTDLAERPPRHTRGTAANPYYATDIYRKQERSEYIRATLKKLALAAVNKEMPPKHMQRQYRRRQQQPQHKASLSYSNYVVADISKRRFRKHLDANIEVLIVVDNSIFNEYLVQNNNSIKDATQKIYQYYNIVFAMVNQRYETITDKSFSIHVNICDIIIAKTRGEMSWLEDRARWSDVYATSIISGSRALRRFQKWLRRNKKLPNFDHAVLLTRYILNKKRTQIDGLAYVGTMCEVQNGKSASIVQDIGDFQSTGVIAHEIAHSLGVSHDGSGTNAMCPASRNNVMSPQSQDDASVARNLFYFSKCSIKQLKRFVMTPKASCLYNEPTRLLTYDMKTTPPGKVFDEQSQCKLAFGSSSRFCHEGTIARSGICSRLWCTKPSENEFTCRSSNRLTALPGTVCGHGKSCHLGECISHLRMVYYTNILPRKEDCPMGDRNRAFCKNIMTNIPYLCRTREHVKEYCCESCAKSLRQVQK